MVNDDLPLSPAISQWLDVQMDILQGNSGLGKTHRTLKVSTPDSQPCPLVDIYQWTLNHCLRDRGPHPRGTRCVAHRALLSLWHSQVPVKGTEELVCAAGCDLAVISELDWLTSGASHLLSGTDGGICLP